MFFFRYLFIFHTNADVQRGEIEKDFQSTGPQPNWQQQLELSKSEARSLEILPSLLSGSRIPKLWIILLLFSQATRRELERDVEKPGHEPALMWDPNPCMARI